MIVKNVTLHTDVPFEEYLRMPGISYSGIRSEGNTFTPTAKMQLGTLVHCYLLTPQDYNGEQYALVKPLALELKGILGPVLQHCEPELAVTADFEYNGLVLHYKGRLDLPIVKRLVVDIKVSEMDMNSAITFFGYNFQLSGYALGISAKASIIASIHPKTKKTKLTNVPINVSWWEDQIAKKGVPIR